MIYYLLPTIAFLIYTITDFIRITPPRRNLFVFLFVLFIIIIGGLRHQIGTDWTPYLELFEDAVFTKQSIEPLFVFLSRTILFLGGKYPSFVFIIFTIAFLLKIWTFNKLSKSIFISLIVYFGFWFYVYDLNQIRQGFSLGLVGLAFYFTYTNNLKFFIISVILATSMHYSAIIFFPFYFIRNISLNKIVMSIIVVLLYFVATLGITDILVNYISSFNVNAISIISILSEKASSYSVSSQYNLDILFSFSTFHRLLIFTITLIFVNKIDADNSLKNLFMTAAFINIVLYLFFSGNQLIAGRLSIYYRFSECLFFSYIPYCFKKKFTQYFVCIVLVAYAFMQISFTLQDPESIESLLPYKNVLFN